jgi:hypothetical protein
MKEKDKAWNYWNIKKKKFKEGDLVLIYDSKHFQHLGKFKMHYLGPYEIKYVIDGGDVQMQDLTGKEIQGLVNGSRLKLYREIQPTKPHLMSCRELELYIV